MRLTLEDNVTNAILFEHGHKGPVAIEAICVANTSDGRRVLTNWYNERKASIDAMRAHRDPEGCCSTCTKCNTECKPDYKETDGDLTVACTSYRDISRATGVFNEPKKRALQG